MERISQAQTRWDAAVVLLETWNERPAGVRPERTSDESLALVDEVREHFDHCPDALDLSDVDRARILEWTAVGTALHNIDAVGFGLSFSSSAGFAQCWRESLDDTHRLTEGEVYPVAEAPWRRALEASVRTPSSVSTGVDADDHPHARVARRGTLDVEFDFSLWRPLRDLALRLDTIAAVTINDGPDELGLREPRARAFPVAATDPELQRERVLGQLDRAIGENARIVVFPELSTSPELAEEIAERLREDDDQRLVICGSWHETEPRDGTPANVSLGVVSGRAARMRHRKIAEFGDFYPRDPSKRHREGIEPPDPPLLRIYVADQFRFALVICKDMLDRDVTAALDRVGANILLVPALSRTTQPFKARALGHVADAQAVSVVANGPRTWDGRVIQPTAIVARPYHPEDVVEAVAGIAPSMALFSVRRGDVRSA